MVQLQPLLDAFFTEKYFAFITCRNYGDSMESDTFCGDSMVKLMRRLFGDLIYQVFSKETPYNLHTNFTIKSPQKGSHSILSPYNLYSNHSGNSGYLPCFLYKNLRQVTQFLRIMEKTHYSNAR